MTIAMAVMPILESIERTRREEGEEAARKHAHGALGSHLGATNGMLVGATVGSAVPVVGTIVGAVVGGLVGCALGGKDETLTDNLRRAGSIVHHLPGLGKP